jgi:4-hydroxy-3-methylbut-2-enyl diphosphate reductase (EC 1.17.1.2)
MIHNPQVNEDLSKAGVRFIMDTYGKHYISWDDITAEDIVIIPAFGTTLEIEAILTAKGINPLMYNTTCPFVEKVWNRAEQIGQKGYTIVIHGKPNHEETRATFSHSKYNAPAVVVRDMNQTKLLAEYITQQRDTTSFYDVFANQYSEGFDPKKDLQKIGVVNQTTMLAEDTQAIADYLKQVIISHFRLDANQIANHFADTRDTLCYATNDNQNAISGMLLQPADLAIIVGGYNSSNTTHLVELCEQKLPTFFIENEHCILSKNKIQHYDIHTHTVIESTIFLPDIIKPKILISSGASCPDAIVERVIERILSFYPHSISIHSVAEHFEVPQT